MIDLLIRGGHAVTPFQEGPLEVGISGETVAYVAPTGAVDADAGRALDATGKLVLPGGVEPHAHIHEPMHRGWTQGGDVWRQPPEGATRAALFGGTTTVLTGTPSEATLASILRGRVVVEDGRLSAEAGYGQFVPRTIDPGVLERPHF